MPTSSLLVAGSGVAGLFVTIVLVPTVLVGSGATPSASAAGNAAATAGACTYEGAPGGGAAAGITLSPSQVEIAAAGVAVVKQRNLPSLAAVDILAAGMQESALRNLTSGDRDSVGWLQQRPSQGWGTVAQIEDPVYAAGQFLDRLVAVPNWRTRPETVAIQAVQRSGFPDAYAQWVPLARALAASLLGDPSVALTCSGGGAGGGTAPGQAPSPAAATILARARSALGLPYCWGGGTANGPSHGFGGPGCGGQSVGYDCSGLTLFAWAGAGRRLEHGAISQYTSSYGQQVPVAQAQPGDLVFLASNGTVAGIHHSAIIWSTSGGPNGAGQIIEAQDYHVPVHVRAWRGAQEPEVMPMALRPNPTLGQQLPAPPG